MARNIPDPINGGMVLVSDPEHDSVLRDSERAKADNKRLHAKLRRQTGETNDIIKAARSWRAYGRYQKETRDAIIELAKKEHANSEAYRLTANKLWEESAKAPRPEERPFASDSAEVRRYVQSAYKEALMNDTSITEKVQKIKDEVRPKYKW